MDRTGGQISMSAKVRDRVPVSFPRSGRRSDPYASWREVASAHDARAGCRRRAGTTLGIQQDDANVPSSRQHLRSSGAGIANPLRTAPPWSPGPSTSPQHRGWIL